MIPFHTSQKKSRIFHIYETTWVKVYFLCDLYLIILCELTPIFEVLICLWVGDSSYPITCQKHAKESSCTAGNASTLLMNHLPSFVYHHLWSLGVCKGHISSSRAITFMYKTTPFWNINLTTLHHVNCEFENKHQE